MMKEDIDLRFGVAVLEETGLQDSPADYQADSRDPLTAAVIGAAIEVHRALGPGLLESAYEECLCHELTLRRIAFERQVSLPVSYKGVKLDCGYRLDLLIEQRLVIEIKTVEELTPVHSAQIITYLKLGSFPCGLLINFHVHLLRNGIKRFFN